MNGSIQNIQPYIQWSKLNQKNMREAANFVWSLYLLIMIGTLLLRTSLHLTTLYYTCRHFASSHLNFTQVHFTTHSFALTPFKFPSTPFHLTSLHFTSLHFSCFLYVLSVCCTFLFIIRKLPNVYVFSVQLQWLTVVCA